MSTHSDPGIQAYLREKGRTTLTKKKIEFILNLQYMRLAYFQQKAYPRVKLERAFVMLYFENPAIRHYYDNLVAFNAPERSAGH